MFDKCIDDRISIWHNFRSSLTNDTDPLDSTIKFWKNAPFVPFNHKIDRFDRAKWPTPWEIIVYNKYDDFTKALMIGWTLKLSEKFKNSLIELKTIIDIDTNINYNIICINNDQILNFSDSEVVQINNLPKTIFIDYNIELI